jgi:hypothetical protein
MPLKVLKFLHVAYKVFVRRGKNSYAYSLPQFGFPEQANIVTFAMIKVLTFTFFNIATE